MAKVVAVLALRQCVSLINKQHAPQRRLQYFKRFDSRLANIARHQARAVHFHNMVGRNDA